MRGKKDQDGQAPDRRGASVGDGATATGGVPLHPFSRTEAFAIGVSLLAACALLLDPLAMGAVRELDEGARQFFRAFTDIAKTRWPIMLAACGLAGLYLFGSDSDARKAKAARRQAAGMLGFLVAAVASSGIAASLIKNVLGRARPKFFEQMGPLEFRPFTFDYDFASFPSGHATSIFTVAAVAAIFWPRARVLLFVIAAWIGATRLLIGAHYLSDVIAGALFGAAVPYLLRDRLAQRRILFRHNGQGEVELRGQRTLDWAVRRLKSAILVRSA